MAVCAENVTDKPWSLVIFLNVYVLRMEDQYENNRFITLTTKERCVKAQGTEILRALLERCLRG